MTALIQNLFYFDALSAVVTALISLIGIIIATFSMRYLHGDSKFGAFYTNLSLLVVSLVGLVSADNLMLFYILWMISNLLLVRLMIHTSSWQAAKNAGMLAQKNFCRGYTFLLIAFVALYLQTGSLSIQTIITSYQLSWLGCLSSIALLFAAMTQSALWPFHKWLLSSLNSPTPVSALMHAGLINGGGFLLARFAPVLFATSGMLQIIFIVGFISSMLGVLFKLMQNDVKRMFACSTMGQMGFMFVQCGLGFFAAAIAHFVWHGFFKAYLFLSTASNIEEQYEITIKTPSSLALLVSLVCGLLTVCCFALVSHQTIVITNTTIVMATVVMITGAQFALSILSRSFKMIPVALLAAVGMGSVYGFNVHMIESLLDISLMQPQPLHWVHVIGLSLYVAAWLAMVWLSRWYNLVSKQSWFMNLYVKILNMSQAASSTITSYRNHYRYK